MTDDTTNPPKLEVTWTPATCEGLPPVGTRVVFPGTRKGVDGEKFPAWISGRIAAYLPPNHEYFPVTRPADKPMIMWYEDGFQFAGLPMPLEIVTLLPVEKQPDGWPDHLKAQS